MKNVNESGRSMVEMLGVLAIIGVLSIGGIAGYTLAMNRYRANEILNAASMVAIEGISRGATNDPAGVNVTYQSLGGTLPTGATAISSDGEGVVTITIDADYADVGTLINQMAGDRMTAECPAAGGNCTYDSKAATRANAAVGGGN